MLRKNCEADAETFEANVSEWRRHRHSPRRDPKAAAVVHLRKIIVSEMESPEGPLSWEFGVNFDLKLAAACARRNATYPMYEKPRVVR